MSASGAAASGRPDRLNPNAVRTSIRPTPTLLVRRLVISAATSTLTDPIENAKPIAPGDVALPAEVQIRIAVDVARS
jgi:hypothetical protein